MSQKIGNSESIYETVRYWQKKAGRMEAAIATAEAEIKRLTEYGAMSDKDRRVLLAVNHGLRSSLKESVPS